MELAPSRILVSPQQTAAIGSVLAANGALAETLPRYTTEVLSWLVFSRSLRIAAVPQARSRSVRKGGRSWHYTPEETRWFRDCFRTIVKQEWGTREFVGCCRVEIDFFSDRPDGLKKPSSNPLAFPVDVRPDADNMAKLIFDSCNKIIWNDDGCVAGFSCFKWYVPIGDEPYIDVRVYELEFSRKK